MIAADSPLQAAKERLTILALWVILGLPGKPGRSCRSPFREDKNPSFAIFDENRRFYDHATGQGGDAVDFIAIALGIPSGDACRKLIELAGVIPQTPHFSRREERNADGDKEEKAKKRQGWPIFKPPTQKEITAVAELRGLSIEASPLQRTRACYSARISPGARLDRHGFAACKRAGSTLDGHLWMRISGKKAWTLPGSEARGQ